MGGVDGVSEVGGVPRQMNRRRTRTGPRPSRSSRPYLTEGRDTWVLSRPVLFPSGSSPLLGASFPDLRSVDRAPQTSMRRRHVPESVCIRVYETEKDQLPGPSGGLETTDRQEVKALEKTDGHRSRRWTTDVRGFLRI